METFAKKVGFTLVELLIVIGIIAILASIVIIAINPSRQFSIANNTERRVEIKRIIDGLNQYSVDHQGNISDLLPAGYIQGNTINIVAGLSGGSNEINLGVLAPTYIVPAIPFDVDANDNHDTGYDFRLDGNNLIYISAPLTELGETTIQIMRKK